MRRLRPHRLTRRRPTLAIIVAIAAITGGMMLIVAQAATYTVATEAEVGVAAGTAAAVRHDSTSADWAVAFGPAGSGPAGIWQPALESPWMWYLDGPLDTGNAAHMGTGARDYRGQSAPDPSVYDIDGFENPAATVTALHAAGKKVICYISAGSAEDWRPDHGRFPAAVLGKPLDGWPGERWLDIRAVDALAPVMQSRLDMCKQKGFDGVEFDNVDGYANDSGFPLQAAHQIAYLRQLAQWAHTRGLAAGLKNDVEQVPQLWQDFDFAINEECNTYDECDAYTRYFVANGKAVFQAEYALDAADFCPAMNQAAINSLKLPLGLDGGRQPCR